MVNPHCCQLRGVAAIMEDARALLNSLMGADRNAKEGERKERKFTDDENCRDFLLGLCTHELFTNTKIALGPCEKQHNDTFKDAFEADPDAAKYRRRWRNNLRTKLRRLLDGVDRRIGLNSIRVAAEKEGGFGAEAQKKEAESIKKEVAEKLKLAEQAADDGKFEESRNIVKEAEATKLRIAELESKRYEKYKKENICAVCGLIIDDEEAEAMKTGRGWHSNGKQHIGYAVIRVKLKEIDDAIAKDRRDGIASPSPSPVKAQPKTEVKSRKSRSRSPAKRRKSKSRTPARRKKSEEGKRKTGRSKSRARKAEDRRPKGGKSKSPAKGRSRSRRRRERSRDKRSRSKGNRSRSRDRTRAKSAKRTSPKRRSPSSQERKRKVQKAPEEKKKEKDKKEKKSKKKRSRSSEKAPPAPKETAPPPPPEAAEAKPPPPEPPVEAPKKEEEEKPAPASPSPEKPRPAMKFFLGFGKK